MRKTIVAIVDDYDGQIINDESDVVERKLTVDGVPRILDLRAETSAALTRALAPFMPPDWSALKDLVDVPISAVAPTVVTPPVTAPEPVAATAPAMVRAVEVMRDTAVLHPEPEPEAEPEPEPTVIKCQVRGCNGEVGTPTGMNEHIARKHPELVPGAAPTKRKPPTRQKGIKPSGEPLPTFEMTSSRKQLGQQINQARLARGLSQSQIAAELRVLLDDPTMSQTAISKIERGGTIYHKRLHGIGELLDVPVSDEGFDGEVPPTWRDGKWLYLCDQPKCAYPGSEDLGQTDAHRRFAHGIGGKSAAELAAPATAQRIAEAKAKEKERIQASVLDAMRDIEGREAPEVSSLPERPTPVRTIVPGVGTTYQPPRPKGPAAPRDPQKQLTSKTGFAEVTMELQERVVEYSDRFKTGIPDDVEFSFLETVESRRGFDKQQAVQTLRNPEWVEVAHESFIKGYPILRFHLDDKVAVLGLRNPKLPMVVAVYDAASLHDDVEAVNHAGPEVRNVPDSLPRTVDQMLDYLIAGGANITYDPLTTTASAVDVVYREQDLGKVPVSASTTRSDVEVAYQRIVRKMAAINDRELATAS